MASTLGLMSRLAWLGFVFALGLTAAPVRVLVVYDSRTGNTEKMAEAVRAGAASVAGVEAGLKSAATVKDEEIAAADGLALGTPVHWHNLSAEAKKFLDRVAEVLSKGGTWGEGRVAGAFSTAGGGSGGQEMARLSVISAFLSMRFVIVGGVTDEGFGSLGPNAITGGKASAITERDRAEARRFGVRLAEVTKKLRAR